MEPLLYYQLRTASGARALVRRLSPVAERPGSVAGREVVWTGNEVRHVATEPGEDEALLRQELRLVGEWNDPFAHRPYEPEELIPALRGQYIRPKDRAGVAMFVTCIGPRGVFAAEGRHELALSPGILFEMFEFLDGSYCGVPTIGLGDAMRTLGVDTSGPGGSRSALSVFAVIPEETLDKLGLTPEQAQAYLASGGVFCPKCRSTDIEGGVMMSSGDSGHSQPICCNACGFQWQDEHGLQSISPID